MSDTVTASKCPVMNQAARRHTMRRIRGTSSVWLVALALSCLLGTNGGMVLAQATGSNPLTEDGGQRLGDDQDSRPAGPHGENMEAGSKCPVTGATRQTHGGRGLFESGLVAESVEPADPSSEFAQEQSDG